jgi:hypothetical protein
MYSDVENAYLDDYMAFMFPPSPEEEQAQAEMKAYDPTMREKLHAFMQAGIEATTGVDKQTARRMAGGLVGGPNSQGPLNLGLADIVPFLGTRLQLEEAGISAKEAIQSGERGDYAEAAIGAGAAALGALPLVGPAVRGAGLAKKAIKKIKGSE